MRLYLLALFCAFSVSASAQWYRVDLLIHKHQRFPALPQAKSIPARNLVTAVKFSTKANFVTTISPGDYRLELAEASVMKEAQHNMRFRIYNVASYNFSDLAALYVKLHRWSEAKWYYLQSNNISRGQNDDKHTMSNLLGLAAIKMNIGDIPSAKADLIEARDLSKSLGMQTQTADIEKQILLLAQNNTTTSKPDVKYAEGTLNAEKKTL